MRGCPSRLTILFLLVLTWFALAVPVHAAGPSREPPNCAKQDDARANFTPRAYTLTSIYVRAQAPEYSFLKGQWVLGKPVATLPPYTCLHILERQAVGVVQIWFAVQYKDTSGLLRRGWVWGGTKDKDEGRYVGGDTRPMPMQRGEAPTTAPEVLTGWNPFLSEAAAQADVIPPNADLPTDIEAPPPSQVPNDATVYLVQIPVLGLTVNVASISAFVLFLVMLAGMIAKAVWDQTDSGLGLLPSPDKIVRPLLVSPIAFSAFWGPMYVQQGGGGLSLTMALYAFQIGFMWQHVLEKRIGGTDQAAGKASSA